MDERESSGVDILSIAFCRAPYHADVTIDVIPWRTAPATNNFTQTPINRSCTHYYSSTDCVMVVNLIVINVECARQIRPITYILVQRVKQSPTRKYTCILRLFLSLEPASNGQDRIKNMQQSMQLFEETCTKKKSFRVCVCINYTFSFERFAERFAFATYW